MDEKIKALIKRYGVKIHKDGIHLAMSQFVTKNPEDKDYIISHKTEIMDYLKAEAEAKQKAAEERQAKIAAIEGLDLLEKTINAWAIYHDEFNRFIENDAIGKPPVKPANTIEEVKSLYPRAAAYVKADVFYSAEHYAKSSAGKKALDSIINGNDYNKAIFDMEKEWSEYCEAHIWD